MNWYGCHVVLAIRFDDAGEKRWPVQENIYLIPGRDEEEAEDKARRRGARSEEVCSEGMAWLGRPAHFEFVGVRRVIEALNVDDLRGDGECEDGDLIEVSYQFLEFESEEGLRDYCEGSEVRLKFLE